jgi:hypothetical protein
MVVITDARSTRGATAVALWIAALAAVACDHEPTTRATSDRDESGPSEPPPTETIETPPTTTTTAALYAHRSDRCGECHESAYRRWTDSPHARAASTPLFDRMRARAASGEACASCHAPLASALGADDARAREGVGCDACHAASARATGTVGLALRLDDDVRYGPIADARDHYFHRMGYSPLHESAELCAACHDLARDVGDAPLAIYGEYDEWAAGPYAREGIACQQCHMPGSHGPVATGSPPREVSDHGFLGADAALRARALETSVAITGDGRRVSLSITLRNRRAGHRVPSGMPGRRIAVRARVMDAAGHELDRAEHVLGRVLVDAAGREAPHHEAVRVALDDRIAPRETRRLTLALDAPRSGQIELRVVWCSTSRELGDALGIVPTEQVLTELRASLGPPAHPRVVGPARRVALSGTRP